MASPWRRIAGLVVGAVYLETNLNLALRDWTLSGLATITFAISTAILIVVRVIGGSFGQPVRSELSARPETHGLRFSIRGLMVLTAAVALFIAFARALRGVAYPERLLLGSLFDSLCFVTVGLVALCAVLDEAYPLGRGLTVLVLSLLLGSFMGIASDVDRYQLVNIILVIFLYSAELLASMLVLRSSGYRFAWQTSQQPVQSSGDGNVGESVLA
jgi:hypothetical protein